jgi:AcrR family transcriptional regulator
MILFRSITERNGLFQGIIADMDAEDSTPLSGRRAEAARNDRKILEAAREVFVKDPEAPISKVAERAGVGIGALYRRYASKEELLRRLCSEGLRRYIAEAEAALADEDDPWAAFAAFMRRIVDADTHSLTLRLAGTFTPTEELNREAARAQELNVRLFERTKAAGAIRPGIEVVDISLLFEQLAAVRIGDEERTRQLRRRYLALLLDALRVPSESPLPGPPPIWEEISRRWENQSSPRSHEARGKSSPLGRKQ